ncbi:MAG: hypothetical protein E6H94_10330 [Chloroflexi bacterium]|nr:MAG: hypothetical protein E6H94_10330 [Chloroflexota bacterium]
MRHVRGLVPYLAVALLVAVGASAIVLTSLGSVSTVGVAPADIARPQGGQTLSATGRIAYFKQEQNGDLTLWAANFDGTRARPLATLPQSGPRPFSSRWTADGGAIAFIGFRITDHRWSPSGRRVAVTAVRSNDNRSEVFIASATAPTFARATDLGDAFVADWLDEEQVLVESSRGLLGTVRSGFPLKRLTERAGASPVVSEGRIFFLTGKIGGPGDGALPYVGETVVWSVGPEGGEGRLEMRLSLGSEMRLDGRWPDGRYLVHLARDRTQWLASTRLVTLASAIPLQRVIVGADRKSAIGLAGARIVRIDVARANLASPPPEAFVVLLDGVIGADAWVPRGS